MVRHAYKPESGRYHLYVSLACPWAHRTIIVRKLKGLEEAIGMTVVDPVRDERGWAFRDGPGHTEDPINGFEFLSEAIARPIRITEGRVTVPVLWDTQTRRIVSNSEDDLLRMFNSEFAEFATNDYDFFPPISATQIDELNKTHLRAGEQRRLPRRLRHPPEAPTSAPRTDCSRRSTNWRRGSPTRVTCSASASIEADWRLFSR